MIKIEAKVGQDEIYNKADVMGGEFIYPSLLRAKGFLTFGGPVLPKLCGRITRIDNPRDYTIMFIQELEECPSQEDLEQSDPRNWPKVCPTLTAAEEHRKRIWRSFWGAYQKTQTYLLAQSKRK